MKLVKFIFEAPLLVLCWCRGLKTNRGRAGTSTSVGLQSHAHLHNKGFRYQDYAGFIYEEGQRGQDNNPRVFLFDGSFLFVGSWFCSTEVFSWLRRKFFEARQIFSKFLPLSLLDPRVFGQGTDSRGTESRGIDSKNFWSRVWFTWD